MTKKLLLLVTTFMLGAVTMFAQNPVISILGGSTTVGWSGDLDMATTDDVTYTYSNLVVTVPSSDPGVKFRQGHDWGTNWGSTAFPSGTATQNGANIPATNGTYNVTFNRTSGAYSFVPVGVTYDVIALVGGGATVTLSTSDGVNYHSNSVALQEGAYHFTINGAGQFGNTNFPSGTAVNPGTITIPANTYNITYSKQTAMYNFSFVNISIIGDGVVNWDTDVDFVTTDGVTYRKDGIVLTSAEAKFRQNHSWDMSWGATDFPNGIALPGGANIPLVAGVYNITFNRITGEYSFVYSTISLIGSAILDTNNLDVDLTTTDGVTYTRRWLSIATGELKFRQNHNWDVNWGNAAFPSGIGTQDGANIQARVGRYDVTFNRNTGAYSFTTSPPDQMKIEGMGVSIPLFYYLDPLAGARYSRASVRLEAGTYHFSVNDEVQYGGTFPTGTVVLNGTFTIPTGYYDIIYNPQTRVFNFTHPIFSLVGTSVPPQGTFIDMLTNDGIQYAVSGVTLSEGFVLFYQNHDGNWAWAGNEFPTGIASLDGGLIPVPAGTYDVTFNMDTGLYNFMAVAGVTTVVKNNVSVYPNPSATGWNFSTTGAALTNVKVTDITGKTVLNQTVSGQTVNVNATGLATGVYFASVTAGSSTTVVRVVKN